MDNVLIDLYEQSEPSTKGYAARLLSLWKSRFPESKTMEAALTARIRRVRKLRSLPSANPYNLRHHNSAGSVRGEDHEPQPRIDSVAGTSTSHHEHIDTGTGETDPVEAFEEMQARSEGTPYTTNERSETRPNHQVVDQAGDETVCPPNESIDTRRNNPEDAEMGSDPSPSQANRVEVSPQLRKEFLTTLKEVETSRVVPDSTAVGNGLTLH